MAKTRVYELARELGMESKDVLTRAQELDIEVKTASSGLDEDAAALVRMSYDDGTPAAAEELSADKELSAVSSQPSIDEELSAVSSQASGDEAEDDEA
ncbi:MAG: translation initiation factor IF-2 N-terminal domain-containing protein, partial [Actinomycetia bacterium]|nr:translation initiation factor IF-2 N-terminal domain-containing protein [Actinomycetes bacterium]